MINDELDCTHLPLLDPICHEDSEGRLLPERRKGNNDDVAKYINSESVFLLKVDMNLKY